MNDYIDEIRAANIPTAYSDPLPNEDDLVLIEEQLLLPLPSDLREFLLHVSDVVCGSLEPVTVTDPMSHTYLPEVAAVAWNNGLARDFIPICQVGDDYYFISDDGGVGLWENGTEPEEVQWPNIWDWSLNVWLLS
jgi:hypothetical protein